MTSYPRTIVVLGTARNVGKTITSLGIIGKLLSAEQGYSLHEIGYIAGRPTDADRRPGQW